MVGVLQPEAHAADGDDPVGQAGVLELAPQPSHRDVEGLGRAVPVLVPDLRHQPAPRHHLAAVGLQHGEHAELLVRQLDLGVARERSPAVDVQPERRLLVPVERPLGAGTPQDRADPRLQLGQAERLAQVVVGAAVETDDAVELARPCGDDDDAADVAALAELAAHLDAVDVGERQVEDHDVDRP